MSRPSSSGDGCTVREAVHLLLSCWIHRARRTVGWQWERFSGEVHRTQHRHKDDGKPTDTDRQRSETPLESGQRDSGKQAATINYFFLIEKPR
jgi:hypothetical protein